MTGLLAGTLDAAAGVLSILLSFHRSPLFFFQFVASGALGKGAFSGGLATAGMGVLIHYAIAVAWVALFFFAYSALRIGSVKTSVAGLAFGLIVWLVMNLIVLPMSHVPKMPLQSTQVAVSVLIVVLLVGLPTSIMARRYFASGGGLTPA